MLRGWIELLLGEAGRALLYLYNHNTLILNGIVILYAVLILYWHNNLRRVVNLMEYMMVAIAKELGEAVDPVKVYHQFIKRWKQQHGNQIYILPSKRDIWYGKHQGSDLIRLLHIEPEYVSMALHQRLGKPEAKEFNPFAYRSWQQHRHRLLLGMYSTPRDPKEIRAEYKRERKKKNKES